jgi:uncharacterized protein YcnI
MKLPLCAGALLAVSIAALAAGSSAWAHAHVSPPLVLAKESQVFTVAVPTEKEDAETTKIELTPPAGFSIDSFVPAPGWKREVQATGSGEEAVIEKVTWSGGRLATGEASNFEFLGRTDASKTYEFKVRQTYSDGTVVDWSGPESSDTPAPLVEAKSSLGGDGGTSTLAVVALVVAGIALVAAAAGLLTGSGRRPLA